MHPCACVIENEELLTCRFMRYLPKMVKHAKEVFLTYIAPVHYNTIR